MRTVDFLKNYRDDLAFWIQMSGGDVEDVNYHTAGTNCFETMEDAWAYLNKLNYSIESLLTTEIAAMRHRGS